MSSETQEIRWTKIPTHTTQTRSFSEHTPETISVEGGGKGDRKLTPQHFRKVDVSGFNDSVANATQGLRLRSKNKK